MKVMKFQSFYQRLRKLRRISRQFVVLTAAVMIQIGFTNVPVAKALATPFGGINFVLPASGGAYLQFWGTHADYPNAGMGARVRVNGQVISANYQGAPGGYCDYRGCFLIADDYRPDVGAAYPTYGNWHGWEGYLASAEFPTSGWHTVCIDGLNYETWTTFACQSYDFTSYNPTTVTPPHTSFPARTIGMLGTISGSTFTGVCSASVVNSTTGRVVLSAAHCFWDNGSFFNGTMYFWPGFVGQPNPPSTWPIFPVSTVTTPTPSNDDPADDFAYMRVMDQPYNGHNYSVSAWVGYRTDISNTNATSIKLEGYPALTNDRRTCTGSAAQNWVYYEKAMFNWYTGIYNTSPCINMGQGVSGAPIYDNSSAKIAGVWSLAQPGPYGGYIGGMYAKLQTSYKSGVDY